MKEEGIPLRTVADSSQENSRAEKTAVRTAAVKHRAAVTEAAFPAALAAKNKVIKVIRAGKRPLQGIKALVRIPIRRSRGESMIRHPITPAALQPSPMAMVRHCFPQDLQRAH